MNRVFSKNEERIKKIFIRKKTIITFFLIVLIIIISYMQEWAFARMQSELNESSKVYIGDFILLAQTKSNDDTFVLDSNSTVEYLFNIKNYNGDNITDVVMDYNLKLIFPCKLPNSVKFKVIDENNFENLPTQIDDYTYVFEHLGYISPDEKIENKYKLKFESEKIEAGLDIKNIKVKVCASQISPN